MLHSQTTSSMASGTRERSDLRLLRRPQGAGKHSKHQGASMTTAVRHPSAVGLAGALALAAGTSSRALIQTVLEGGSSPSRYCAPQEGRVGSAKDLLPWLARLGPFGRCERWRMASCTALIRVRYDNDFGHPSKFLVLFHSLKRTTTAAADLVTKTLYASGVIAACSRSHVP